MSLIFDGPVSPDAATAFVRQVPPAPSNVLNTILPDRLVNEQVIKWSEYSPESRTAQFRAYDGNIPSIERDSMISKQVEMQPVSVMNGKGELERLGLERVRQEGGAANAVAQAIYDDLTLTAKAVHNRVEQARGDVLLDGKLTINENGVIAEADFGVPANNLVSATTDWDDSSATVVTDIQEWAEHYREVNGFDPGGMIVGRRILGLLQRNSEFREYAGIKAGGPATVTLPTVTGILSDYGLPPVGLVYDNVIGGSRVLPDEKIIFVPPAGVELGYTYWGVTATALELLNAAQSDLSFTEAPGLAGAVVKDGPPFRERTLVDAIVLPVITNPKALMISTVLS